MKIKDEGNPSPEKTPPSNFAVAHIATAHS